MATVGLTRENFNEVVGAGGLDAYIDAIIAHYADRRIGVVLGADEQRDLSWNDLRHVRESTAFFGSGFWDGYRSGMPSACFH